MSTDSRYVDCITELTASTPRGQILYSKSYVKAWDQQGSVPPQFPYFNLWETHPLKDIYDLSDILFKLENDPQSCVIRGVPIGGIADPCRRRKENFNDQAHHWVCFDFDSIPGVLSPQSVVEQCLPGELHNASFHWQYSGSQGFKPGTRLHVWFWMDCAVTSTEWIDWLSTHGLDKDGVPETPVDPALFRVVQPHITSKPVLKGVVDPVEVRSGFQENQHKVAEFTHGRHPVIAKRIAASDVALPPIPEEWKARQTGVIGRFNLRFTVGNVLDWYGYQQVGDRYLHPYSSSLLPDTVINSGTHAYAFSPNNPLYEQGVDRGTGEIMNRNHDAFDCFRILGFEGQEQPAVAAAASLLETAGVEA